MNSSAENKRKLRLLFWESTVKCNLTCAHCRRVETDDSADSDMSTQQAKQLIEQLSMMGARQEFMPILVFSGGEPLCRNDIFELISYAAGRGIKCALATNGTLIDPQVADKIKNAGVQRVSVSLDGATSAVHNKLRLLKGSFEAAISGINCLRKSDVPFQINMTMTRYNVQQLDDLFLLAERLGAVAVHLFMLVPVGCGQEFAREDMLSAEEYEHLLEKVAKIQSSRSIEVKVTCGPHYERIIREQNPQATHMSRGCLAGSGVLFVGHKGQVFPCGYLPVDCGSILRTSIEQIWNNSDELSVMRDVRQLKGKCKVCGYRAVCGGCRARAFAATGDYMQAEPMCRYIPRSEK